MRKKSVGRLLILLLCFTLLITACSGGNQSSEEAPSDGPDETAVENQDKNQNESPKEIKTIRVGYAPGIGNILGFIAEERGIAEKEGIKLEFVPFTNSSDGLNALNAGKIDVGVSFGTAAPLTFVTQGVDFSIFGGYLSGGMPIYAKPDFEYTGPESFKGKTVATARLYTPDIVWRAAMYEAGIDIEKDLTLIEVKKPSEILEIVKAGKADVGIGTGSTYAKALESGLVAVAWSNDLWDPVHVCCRPVAKTDWIGENRDIVKAFLRSFIQAEKIYNEDPEYAVELNKKYLELDDELARIMTLEANQIIEADPKSNGVRYMWDRLHDIGYLNSPEIDVNNHINVELYKEALDELTAENPDNPFYKKLQERFVEYNL